MLGTMKDVIQRTRWTGWPIPIVASTMRSTKLEGVVLVVSMKIEELQPKRMKFVKYTAELSRQDMRVFPKDKES